MTLEEAQKMALRLFDIHGITPYLRVISGEIYAVVMVIDGNIYLIQKRTCLLYTSPSPRDGLLSRMPSSA